MKKIVLMYHDVYRDSPSESGFDTHGANHYKISERMFERQLKVLSQLISDNKVRREDIVITFDDGGLSFSEIIMPLLNRYGFVGHFYIAADYIGTTRFMTSDQVKCLVENGHIVGSHSSSHPENISALEENTRELEWSKSLKKLSEICGGPIREVSIPNGFFDKKDVRLFKEHGVEYIYTSSIGEDKVIEGLYVIGRIAIDVNMSLENFKNIVSGGFQLNKLKLRQTVLGFFKRLLGDNYMTIKRIVRRWIR